jgi:uncharacterized DUF497 family protein
MGRNIRWDPKKAELNSVKHGVSFEMALEALEDSLVLSVRDERHDTDEVRYLSVGRTKRGRLLTVGHTDDDDELRVITARDSTPRERKAYEG